MIKKILKRFGYVKQTSYRFYIKDTNWIQVVVSPKGIYNKTVGGHTLPISELAIYEGECLKLEDTYNPDRTKETDLLEWYNMGDQEIYFHQNKEDE
jgi:cytoskeletal protein CcmA (bactofilin family)